MFCLEFPWVSTQWCDLRWKSLGQSAECHISLSWTRGGCDSPTNPSSVSVDVLNVFDTSSIERDGLHQKMVILFWFKNTTWIHIHTHIAETPRFSTCIEYKSQMERFQIQTGKIVSTIPGNTILRGGVGHQRCSHGASRHCARVPWLRWWQWVWWVANWTILKWENVFL